MSAVEEAPIVVAFGHEHLDEVLRLCEAEGWPSFPADPARALRAFTAPGVTTLVAAYEGEVIGFAHVLSDGEVQAYLSLIAVETSWRRRGVARALVEEAFRRIGAKRLDVLSEEEAAGLYEALPHRAVPGYRLYPPERGGSPT